MESSYNEFHADSISSSPPEILDWPLWRHLGDIRTKDAGNPDWRAALVAHDTGVFIVLLCHSAKMAGS